ncbi:MAG TPA: SUMF1/EgtB/PvdO family nonheme iron enzyme [Candidatus Hydrogenedentes bacterium]|nr:SUMF1/EgtB/PvdO family nonheme iron enzyme [Candidatus Hydrogenedentota bacterium]
MIQVTCSNCGIQIQVPETVQGRQGLCFGCGAQLRVPAVSSQDNHQLLTFSQGEGVADRYVIEEELGRGGMGVVYRAQDNLVNETVALKFMKPHMLKTQRGQRLFIREAQIARRLRHENIVAVHDVGFTVEGILYLSMEFLKGHSLRALLRKHRQHRRHVDVRLTIRVIAQVLSALEYAHRTVVHRDMKPENVMLLPGEHVKVLDFGLAKAMDEANPDLEAHTKDPNRIVGTLAYSAPEQRLHREIDLRTDLYTVGLLLHEMFTLRTPMDEPVEVVDVRDDVAPSLVAILDKALREDKDDRWQTALEFRNSLLQAYEKSYRPKAAAPKTAEAGPAASTENMVFLEGGSFLMGNPEYPEEAPEFETEVAPFYMDIHPVTVQQYDDFLKATGHREPKFWLNGEFNGLSQPVVGVSWEDARTYADWAGKQLPTETQWEFAARGKENRKYPWGNLKPDPTRCNYGDHLNMPSIIGMHESGATPDGIQDLAGNVYEWTIDLYVPYDPGKRRTARPDAPRRAVRGGSWHSNEDELRCTWRKGLFPEAQLTTVGFRCVLLAR